MGVDFAGYEQKRKGVETDWAQKTAVNDYGRHVSQQRGSRQIGDLTKRFKTGWGQTASGWGNRGHTGGGVNSGFYQKAMQNYLGDYQQARARQAQDFQDEQFGINMQGTQLDVERQRALAELEMQKQRDIAMFAQNIQAAQQGLG